MVEKYYLTLDDFDYQNKVVILRVDINSPIDSNTKMITDETRIEASLPTIEALNEKGAKLVIIAHQGDTLDYQNLVPMQEHAIKLSEKLNKKVMYVDDVAGPAARNKIKQLVEGDILLLDNLRYLTEEVSTFEDFVKIRPEEMINCYLIKNLAPLADYYVNDAFAAAHRASPSMVAFQELLPSAAGILFDKEVSTLNKILENPLRPAVFLLGGLKVSDPFAMIENVLVKGSADYVLTTGITGLIMLMGKGQRLGPAMEKYVSDKGMSKFIDVAKALLSKYSNKIMTPVDFGIEENGKRKNVGLVDLPTNHMIIDIGPETVGKYQPILEKAGVIFVSKPAGKYESPLGSYGTEELWKIVSASKGYSVIGGGDTIASAAKYIKSINYVCTGGGALTRYVAGIEMPLMKAMNKAKTRWIKSES